MQTNKNYDNLEQSYLFSTIARKVREYSEAHPEADIIRLGIGDVTRPLVPAVIDALHAAVEDQAKQETFHGYGSNVKEVTTQVSEGAVDCGIIYATDAFSAGLDTVDEATADMCGQVIYPAAVLKNSTHADEAKAFLDYLTTDEAGKVFESVGFTTLA